LDVSLRPVSGCIIVGNDDALKPETKVE